MRSTVTAEMHNAPDGGSGALCCIGLDSVTAQR